MASFTTSNSKSQVVEAEIWIGPNQLPKNVQVDSVQTCHEINQIPTATVVLTETAGRSSTKGKKTVGKDFDVIIHEGGKLLDLEIKLGTPTKKKTVFKGQCRRKKTGSGQGGAPGTVTIEGEGIIVVEDQTDVDYHHKDKKDSDVIKKCLGSAAGKVDATTYKHECLTQMRISNYKFAKIRAKAVGHVLAPQSNGKVDSVKPKFTNAATYTYGIDIQSDDINLNVEGVAKKVKAVAWNPATQKKEEATVTISQVSANEQGPSLTEVAKMNGDQEVVLQSPTPLPQSELKVWAEGEILRRALGRYEGSLLVDGNYDMEVNTCVKLEELGEDLNGLGYISKVEHDYDSHDWNTTLHFGLNSESAQTASTSSGSSGMQPPAAGGQIAPAPTGIHIAKVVNIWEDKDGEHRILVMIPSLQDGHNQYWARILQAQAFNKHGWYMLPEKDEEVAVMFAGDDPRFPLIIGSLYSSKHPMPVKAEGGGDWDGQKDTNNIKGFFSKAGIQMRFQEKDIIFKVDTPGKYHIEINEKEQYIEIKDKTKNFIKMSPKGIEIDSPKDIKITAKGKIVTESKMDTSMTAKMNLKMEAKMNLSTKASIKNSHEGATFSVKGSAFGEVKAALVKIN